MSETRRSVLLFTGVTGKVGYQAALQSLDKGYPTKVILRKDGARAAELRKLGAIVIIGDLMSTADVRRAVTQDVKAVLYVPPIHELMLQASAVMAAAVEDARVPFITTISQWYASPNHPSIHTQHQWLTERMFLRLSPKTKTTRIRVGMFADNFLSRGLLESAIQTGTLPNMWTHGVYAPVSNEDIAASCVATMFHAEKFAGRVYRPSGPVNISFEDIRLIVEKVAGRKVTLMNIDQKMASKALTLNGIDEFAQQAVLEYTKTYSKDAQEVKACTNHVEYLTGRPAEDFESIVRRYAKEAGEEKTLMGWTASIWGIVRIMMSSTADINAWLSKVQIPRHGLEEPLQSDEWRREADEMPVNY